VQSLYSEYKPIKGRLTSLSVQPPRVWVRDGAVLPDCVARSAAPGPVARAPAPGPVARSPAPAAPAALNATGLAIIRHLPFRDSCPPL
jgi:hypothetical protein